MNTEALASELLTALETHSQITPITVRKPDFDATSAYQVAAEIVRRRWMRGETPVGRKIGFTNRTIWEEYGVYTPIWGHVYDSAVTFLDGPRGELPIGHLAQPRIEPEIVLHFREAPAGASDELELLERIDWIAHGFEIVQSHYPDWKFQAPDTMAAFGLHGALVIGRPVPVSELGDVISKLRAFTISLAHDGEIQAQGGGANVLDSPLMAMLHFLALLDTLPDFAPVAAGEVVMTGTLTVALPVAPGDTWTTALEGLELPGMNVRFR